MGSSSITQNVNLFGNLQISRKQFRIETWLCYQSYLNITLNIQKCKNIQNVPFKITKLVYTSCWTGSCAKLKIFSLNLVWCVQYFNWLSLSDRYPYTCGGSLIKTPVQEITFLVGTQKFKIRIFRFKKLSVIKHLTFKQSVTKFF